MTGVVTVIITGGGGFLGQCLASSLLSDPKVRLSTTDDDDGTESEKSESDESIVERIVLADVAFPPEDELQPAVARGIRDGKIECRLGSVADESFCSSLVDESSPSSSLSVFHLGAVMSGTGESDFDLCMNVNLRGTMTLLERCRSRSLSSSSALPAPVRFVYASAGATVGSGSPTDYVTKDDTITDAARSTPHTTYGMTKACGELLLSDYSRRGFVDGRGARLPTVVVRAGRPNAATTGCFSGVVRETLGGIDSILPIGPDVKHAVTGMRNAVDALRTLHDLPTSRVEEALGYDRTVFLPATALSLSDLEDATKDAVSPLSRKLLGRVEYTVDEFLSGVVGGFPTRIDAGRARELGVGPPPTPEDIVRDYAASFPEALAPGLELSPKAASAASADGSENKDNDDDDDDNNNVVAVITGAGSGIGRAVALRLAQGGWGPRPALDQKKEDSALLPRPRGTAEGTIGGDGGPRTIDRRDGVDVDRIRRRHGRDGGPESLSTGRRYVRSRRSAVQQRGYERPPRRRRRLFRLRLSQNSGHESDGVLPVRAGGHADHVVAASAGGTDHQQRFDQRAPSPSRGSGIHLLQARRDRIDQDAGVGGTTPRRRRRSDRFRERHHGRERSDPGGHGSSAGGRYDSEGAADVGCRRGRYGGRHGGPSVGGQRSVHDRHGDEYAVRRTRMSRAATNPASV
uniref:NAD-dependent epimerase/dehydratase domain-containing protein n=1 Tax=Odontella aurita TaxID=265563 RepID=A0A7S4M5Y4_9STRA|mmetsp:Transcript_12211/g.35775  ORF Transcript_12211/g.35775 Transcript_12211/m.35775 type:complete len:689 (+) Transcript_12211:99-2165(+)